MDIVTLTGIVIPVFSAGAASVWKLIHDRYKGEIALKDEQITTLKTENSDLKDQVTIERTRADAFKEELETVRTEKERQQPVVDSVLSLRKLAELQGEKITALETKVEALGKETSALHQRLETEVTRVQDLQTEVARQTREIEVRDVKIGTYESVFEKLGVKLNENPVGLSS